MSRRQFAKGSAALGAAAAVGLPGIIHALRPGPIYLQGNHSDIDYRNIVLRPVLK